MENLNIFHQGLFYNTKMAKFNLGDNAKYADFYLRCFFNSYKYIYAFATFVAF